MTKCPSFCLKRLWKIKWELFSSIQTHYYCTKLLDKILSYKNQTKNGRLFETSAGNQKWWRQTLPVQYMLHINVDVTIMAADISISWYWHWYWYWYWFIHVHMIHSGHRKGPWDIERVKNPCIYYKLQT